MSKRLLITALTSLAFLTGCGDSDVARQFRDASRSLLPDSEDSRNFGALIRSIVTDVADSVMASVNRTAASHARKARAGSLVSVTSNGGLMLYTPEFKRIDLVTGTMPSKDETDVILVCEAAFTGELLEEFRHSNIAGHHVSGGEFHKGFKCGPNNGVFTWSAGDGWHFYNCGHSGSVDVLKKVAAEGGMGFCQSLLFLDGKRFKGGFKADQVNRYRALCELDGRLCIADCGEYMTFGAFMDELEHIGVTNAIYCDMGPGWNYSWYRRADGTVQEIFTTPGKYTTNWVTFYSSERKD